MFQFPTLGDCKRNMRRMIKEWEDKSVINISNDMISQAERFFNECMVFHHFVIKPNFTMYIQKGQLPPTLSDGFLKSKFTLSGNTPYQPCERTLSIDIELGLHRYIFFSYGVPVKSTGRAAVIFALPLRDLVYNFTYPLLWSSWGDIINIYEKFLGKDSTKWSEVEHLRLEQIKLEYSQKILLAEDIPETAAFFSCIHYPKFQDAIIHQWKTNTAFNYQGPEIKIKDQFPIKMATYCFIDSNNSLGGKFAYLLYENGLLRSKPIIDQYFRNQRCLEKYVTEFFPVS